MAIRTRRTYADAVSTLFPVAYKLKFLSKSELDRDYVVMPLEALWWSDDMATFTTAVTSPAGTGRR